ncbi:alanyl-tRNA editing protein [Chitinimonas sp. BJB300]|uniref:alanyl-tRNA editing protein n=1 Tax=Chitinimonas sp. BJB300 TaxID=1559339 RepID=UPI000C1079A9|nr:alanyl-tRNA editing protein [Chitinimonas sp. BJB300]PHV12190.1 Ala-tRNA(Pro) hydrolase [Chitinimonas sp. BJB300]TSJ91595.1 alanyl-tRNA editing protein [Chitinimonas sp. BJB300]
MSALLFREDAYLQSCTASVTAVDVRGIQFDRTVFYPNGGGQPGDVGSLQREDGSNLAIVNTIKGDAPDEVLHVLADGVEQPAVGETVRLQLDWDRRYAHMRYHTALHLLCAVVAAPVTGGQVAQDKARLDFAVDMDALNKDAIETGLNAFVAAGHAVDQRWISDAELDAQPELIKTMSVSPPRGAGEVRLIEVAGTDLQPCGGTHVCNTAEIGRLVVQKIKSEGKQNKRVIIAFAA